MSAASSSTYSLANSDGVTWQEIDQLKLRLTASPSANQSTLLSANADLFTDTTTYNQDIGIFASDNGGADTLLAWKESGGFAGTFSPDAAYVQYLYNMTGGHSYVFKLKWKTNKNAPGVTIYAGAGSGASFPTRSQTSLAAETFPSGVVPNFVVQTQSYTLANSNGITWLDIDPASNLTTTLSPGYNSTAVLAANADLWTAYRGYNQDLGIFVSDNGGADALVAWKESGGFAGTYSPNAAFVKATFPMTGGHRYAFKLKWKTNINTTGASAIFAGAGPLPGSNPGQGFSPTSLLAETIAAGANPYSAVRTNSASLANSDGVNWQPVDHALDLTVSGSDIPYALLGANADLFTDTTGYNQDIGIFVSDNGGADTLVAWKESGGFGGTYSPNAAFAQAIYPMVSGHTCVFKLKWKTNKNAPGVTIYAGAGSGTSFPTRSHTSLTIEAPPTAAPNVTVTLHGSRTTFARGEPFQVDVGLVNPNTTSMPAATAAATLPSDLIAPRDASWMLLDGTSCPASQCTASGQSLTLTTPIVGSGSHTFTFWVAAVGSERGCNNDSLAATATAQGSMGQSSSSVPATLCDGGVGNEAWWSYVKRSADPQTTAAINIGTGNMVVTSEDAIPTAGHGSLILSLHRAYNSSASGNGTLGSPVASGWSLTVTPLSPAGLYVPAGEDQLAFPVTLLGADGQRSLFSLTSLATPIDVTGMANAGNTNALAAIEPRVLQPDTGYTRVCVDMVGQAPAGVHLGLWRYVEVVSGASPCVAAGGTATHVLGFGVERPDRVRYEFASDGHIVDLMDGNGNELKYQYVNAAGAGVQLGNLIRAFEVASGRGFSFTYPPQEADVTDPAGQVTKYKLDASSRLVNVVNPDSSSEQYGYGGCAGASAMQLCSITDPRGHLTTFTYGAAPAGPPKIASVVDRYPATTTFTWSTSPDTATVDEGSERTKYSSFDASGSPGEEDQLDTSVSPNAMLRSSLMLWDTVAGPCRQPDSVVDHNLCRTFRKVLDGSTAAEDTSYTYGPFGDVLVKRACLAASDPAAGQMPGACGSAAASTSGFNAQYVRAAATNIYADAVAGSGSVTSAAGPGPGGARADSTTLFAIRDQSQSLTPLGNAAGSGYAPYLTALYPDDNSNLNPNLPGTASTCSSVGAPATNTGDQCGADAPSFDGTHATSTRLTYDSHGQVLTKQTPKAIAETPSGQTIPAVAYTYYLDTDRDLSGTTVAGGWLKAVTDPLGNFTAYAYDAYGHAVRKWDPDATAGHTLSQFPGGVDGTLAQGGPPTCQYGETLYALAASEPTWGQCPAQNTVTRAAYGAPWRYPLAQRDALGNLATNTVDASGNVLRKRPPRGNPTSGAATTFDIVSTYDARDQVLTVLNPVEAGLGGSPETTYSNDLYGNQSAVTDPLGNVAVTRHDAVNRPIGKIWTRGPWPSPGVAPPSCRQSISSDAPIPSGRILCNSSQGWNGVDGMTSSTDGNHNTTTMTYDGLHRQLTTLAPRNDGQFTTLQTTKTYDLDGNVAAICPPRHYTEGSGGACAGTDAFDTLMTYDPSNRLTAKTTYENSMTPARSQTMRYAYDADGNLIQVTDANTHRWAAAYDLLNRQTSVSVPRSASVTLTTSYAYDPSGHTLSVATPDGATTYRSAYSYDGDGRVVDTVKGSSGGTGGATTSDGGQNIRTRLVYDADGHVVATYSPRAFASSTAPGFAPDEAFKKVTNYDADGRPTRVYMPRADTAVPDITPANNGAKGAMEKWCPTATTNSNGDPSWRPYPSMPSRYPTYPADVELCYRDNQYDAAGHRTGVVDQVGTQWTTQFSDDGLKAASLGPSPVDDSTITTMAYYYDGNGKVVKTVDALQRQTSYTYTADELQLSRTDPPNGSLTHVSSWGYDANGNKTSLTDPAGNVAKQTYLSDNRVAAVMTPSDCSPNCASPPGNFDVTSYAYDPAGNVVSMMSPSANAKDQTNPQGLVVRYGYTWDNRLQQQMRPTLADGSRWSLLSYQYNAVGLKTAQDSQLTDSSGATVYADAGQQTFTYLPDQRLKQEAGRDGVSTNKRSYDADGNATSLTSTNAAGQQTASVTSDYYLDGLLRTTTSNDVNATPKDSQYDYTGTGRTYQRSIPSGFQFTQYNAAGLPVDIGGYQGYVNWDWAFSYFATGEAQKVEASSFDNRTLVSRVINDQTYTLNPDDTLAGTTVTTGSPATTTAQWSYTYDKNKRKTQWSFSGTDSSGAAASANGSAAYYPSGRLQQTTETGPGSTPVTKTAAWDRDGNRLGWGSAAFSYNPDDSIAHGTLHSYVYNAARDLTQDDCGSYSYDAFDRRATASIPGGRTGCPTTASTVTYGYDALDRTVSIDTQQAGKPDTRSQVMYAGLGRIEDSEQNWSGSTENSVVTHVYDIAGNLKGVFGYAPNGTDPSSVEIATDNGMGSISTMSGPTGQVGCDAFADAFGAAEFMSGGTTPCSTGASLNTVWYQGARLDTGAGTYQFGTRTYNPTTASWSQPDGYRSGGGGDLALSVDPTTRNPYSYVDGDPLNHADLSGHDGWGFLGDAWNAVTSAAGTAWNDVASAAGTAWNAVTSIVGTAWNDVTSAVSGAWNFVTSTVSTAYQDASAAFDRQMASIDASIASGEAAIAAGEAAIAAWEQLSGQLAQQIAQQAAQDAADAASLASAAAQFTARAANAAWNFCTGSLSGAGTCLAATGMVVVAATGVGLIADVGIAGAISSGLFLGSQALSAADGIQRGDPLEIALSVIPGAGGAGAGAAERAVLPEAETLANTAEHIGGTGAGLDITGILSEHVAAGSERFAAEGLSQGQARALVNNPGLEAAFRGERIDTFAKESAALDPRLEGIQITGRFQRGADFIDPATGNWWDITTPGSWASHVLRYGPGGTMLPY